MAREMTQPVVSVIMSMRNAADTVAHAIRSLRWQTLREWELILMDDGSNDLGGQIAASFADSRIRVHTDGQHRGLAARLNQAVGLARAELIARMDADDICFPERLAAQVAFLKDHPRVDLAACSAAVFVDGGEIIGLLPVARDHGAIVANLFRGFPFPHPTWCGRAEWFRAHPYDPTLPRAQDQDLLLRCHPHSVLAGLPEVLLGYRQDRLKLKAMLQGRLVYVRAIWRYGRNHRPLASVLTGIGMQGFKAAADVALSGIGLNKFSQRQRLAPATAPISEAWVPLWAALQTRCEVPICIGAGSVTGSVRP